MSFTDLAARRYSARKFTSRKVENEKLEKILEAGRIAPTAANKQPQRILIIQSDEGLAKAAKGARYYDAPLLLLVCADKNEAWVRNYDQRDTCDIDASIITDHMMLEATDLGLDTLWMTWFDPQIIRSEFSIPENLKVVNLLAIGYNGTPPLSPERHSETRKSLSETVFYENF